MPEPRQSHGASDIGARVAEIRQENRGGDVSFRDIEWLCNKVLAYRRSLVEHHNLDNVSDAVIARYDWRECPVCREARRG